MEDHRASKDDLIHRSEILKRMEERGQLPPQLTDELRHCQEETKKICKREEIY